MHKTCCSALVKVMIMNMSEKTEYLNNLLI